MREVPLNVVRGFLMGAADIVPGVSGGTIALVVGIYERFVDSIRSGSRALFAFVKLDGKDGVEWLGRVDWKLLVPLLVGITLAVLTLAQVIEDQLHDRAVQMAALFLGLVAGSAVIAWQALRHRTSAHLVMIAVTTIVVFVLLGIRQGTSEETVGQMGDPASLAFFGAGAIAIWAMVLPGISGSFILVTLGMYSPVLAAVNDRDLGTVAVFLLGAIVGLAVFSQILHWALTRYHDTVMAVLIGLMAGSLRVLWPWPRGVDSTVLGAPDEVVISSIAFAAAAFVAVLAISRLAQRISIHDSEQPTEAVSR